MDGIQLSEPRIVPTGADTNGLNGAKRVPDGKEGLLTTKPPPLEGKVASPHRPGKERCSGVCSPTSKGRCCVTYTPVLAILGLLLLLIGLGLLGQDGKLAGNSLSSLLFSATGSSGGMGGRLLHAYRGAYVATVIIATLLLVLVIVDYLLRVAQRLRQDGRWGAGVSTERRYIALEWVTASLAALMYAFCAWLAIYFAIMIVAYAGMMIAQQGSHFAGSFFGALLPILNQWLINANASYTAMTSLLSEVPAVGANAAAFVNTAFKLLIPTPANIQNFLNTQTGGNLSYLINTLLGSPATIINGVRSCGAGCIDLNKYPFMKSDLCLCNSPLLQQLAAQAANTRMHLLRAIVGIALMYLGSSLLLSRLSAEAASIRHDTNLLWSNKYDRLMMRRSRTGDAATVGQASSMRAPTAAQTSPARGPAYAV